MNNFYDENGNPICQICGKSFKFITSQHLKLHNISREEYLEKYGNPPMKKLNQGDLDLKFLEIGDNEYIQDKSVNHFKDLVERKGFDKVEQSLRNISEKYTATRFKDIPFYIWLNNILFEISNKYSEESNSFDLEEYYVDEESITIEDPSELYIIEKFTSNKEIPSQKLEILKLLYERSKYIENDYIIELYDDPMKTILRYSFVTDIADPKNKEAFFFPDVFWRNEDENQHPDKFKILEDYGWTVYVIRGTNVIVSIKQHLNI